MANVNIPAATIEKMIGAALELMAKRASNLEPGEKFSASDIASAIAADPKGNTAFYFADLIATGVNVYPAFLEMARQEVSA